MLAKEKQNTTFVSVSSGSAEKETQGSADDCARQWGGGGPSSVSSHQSSSREGPASHPWASKKSIGPQH